MATAQEIARGLNAVRTVGQVKLAIGDALSALGQAYQLESITPSLRGDLDLVRLPLETWFKDMVAFWKNDDEMYPYWGQGRVLIDRAYVEIAGVGGYIEAFNTLSFVDALDYSAFHLPDTLKDVASWTGETLGEGAKGVGNIGGSLLGGLLSGLGPIVVVIIAIVLVLHFREAKG